jgi:adenylate kinase
MRCVLIGLPGSGKGTQAANLAAKFGIAHISTGDILRAAMKSGSDLGSRARNAVERGELVSDDIVIGLVRNRIREPDCRRGFVLDGFPRTVEQAVALRDACIRIEYVIELDVAERDVMARMSGRRVHPASGRVYHVKFKPPRTPGKDDETGDPLVQRPDDREDVIGVRIAAYNARTLPIIDYYVQWERSRDLHAPRFIKVNGHGSAASICERLSAVMTEVTAECGAGVVHDGHGSQAARHAVSADLAQGAARHGGERVLQQRRESQ